MKNVDYVNTTEKAFGDEPLIQSKQSDNRKFSVLKDINENLENYFGSKVWLRCRLVESRCKGNLAFLILRQPNWITIQCVISSKTEHLKKDAIKWAATLSLESILDVYGEIIQTQAPVIATTVKAAEISIEKIFCISKSSQELPFQLKDAIQSDIDEKSLITVGQDVRLHHRVLDLRTPANHHIFILQSAVSRYFRDFLLNKNFIEIHSPKLMSGFAEGGATVFKLKYFNRDACLAQSPQLHKQMAICADMQRVFEIGPVFRAENSNTHRHLCEFTGLDLEMEINNDYTEVLDLLEELFIWIFQNLKDNYAETSISIVQEQHQIKEPFVWLNKNPRLSFKEGIEMMRKAKVEGIPEDLSNFDLSTEMEKILGKLVKEKYNTDFFMLLRYPLKVRPFYTMPCSDDSTLSNSYDFFMRGEEVLSGAQRIHDSNLLTERAKECAINVELIQSYIDAFKLGAPPHGGCGIGLERVLMLFLGLKNIRKTCLFPRDPKRLEP